MNRWGWVLYAVAYFLIVAALMWASVLLRPS